MILARALIVCCLAFLYLANSCYSQQQDININVCMIDKSSGKGIEGINIEVAHIVNGAFKIENLDLKHRANCINFSYTTLLPDTFYLRFSHALYNADSLKIPVQKGRKYYSFIVPMLLKQHVLDTVTVMPPMWKSGDTTFYNVAAFKEGEEKKLVDLLNKLPDFRVDENSGDLSYKGARIAKLTIEGSDLMASRVQSLMANFPVHVLETIQVIEQHQPNKVLKGLSGGSETIVNIGLNKKSKLTVFGETGNGAGNKGMYLSSSSLFSVKGKWKHGLITNFNSSGKFGEKYYNDYQRGYKWYEADSWTSKIPMLFKIENLDQRNYTTLKENIFQYEYDLPISKKLKQKLEISGMSNRQSQSVNSLASVFSVDTITTITDTSNIVYRSKDLNIINTFIYDINKANRVEASITYNIKDAGENNWQNKYVNDIGSGVHNTTNSNNHGFVLNAEYSSRFTDNTGMKLSGEWLKRYGVNNAISIADAYKLIYTHNYNTLAISPETNFNFYKAIVDFYFKNKRGRTLKPSIVYNSKRVSLSNSSLLKSQFGDSNIVFNNFSSLGNYRQDIMYGQYGINFPIKKTGGWISTNYKIGLIRQYRDTGIAYANSYLYYRVDMDYENSYSWLYRASIFLYSEENRLNQLLLSPFPENITNYYGGMEEAAPVPTLGFNLFLKPFKVKKMGNSNSLSFFGTITSKSIVFNQSFLNLIGYRQDSLINKVRSNYSIAWNQQLRLKSISALFEYRASASFFNSYYMSGGTIQTNSFQSYSIKLSLKKDWNKLYFIRLENNLRLNNMNVGAGSSNRIDGQNITGLWQRAVLYKKISAELSTQWHSLNFISKYKKSLFFSEIDCNYNLNDKWSFGVSVSNLTNIKEYRNMYNSETGQYYTSYPFIGRNFLLTINLKF
ncbi:MAG: hypothetical protein ACK5NK_07230 [Niabella sp.]